MNLEKIIEFKKPDWGWESTRRTPGECRVIPFPKSPPAKPDLAARLYRPGWILLGYVLLERSRGTEIIAMWLPETGPRRVYLYWYHPRENIEDAYPRHRAVSRRKTLETLEINRRDGMAVILPAAELLHDGPDMRPLYLAKTKTEEKGMIKINPIAGIAEEASGGRNASID